MIDDPNIVALDTETFYSKKLKYTVDSRSKSALLPEAYAAHHLFDCFIVSICNGPVAWAGHPTELDWSMLEGTVLLSHNARFDQAIIRELINRGVIPNFTPRAWYCTASMAAYLWNRRGLAETVEHVYGVAVDKSSRENSDGKHWPKDYTDEQQRNFLEYARGDVRWCRKLFIDHGDKWPALERRISGQIIRRASEGVQIDTQKLDNFIMWTHETKMTTQKLLPWLTDEWDEEDEFDPKPTSTKCIAEECRRTGIPCPPVKEHEGEEAFEEWELTYGLAHPWIGALSCWRSVNKLLRTCEKMKSRLLPDGTMPFGQKYCGTTTGRVAGEGQVNMFNQRKLALLVTQAGLVEPDDLKVFAAHETKKETGSWPDWVKYAIDIRNLIIARPGKKLIVSDLSQIEPRVAAYLAGDWDFLNLVTEGHGPYQAHAILTMGWPADKKLKVHNEKLYSLAKARLLSLNYGAAWEKLIVMARSTAGLDLTVDDPEWVEEKDVRTGVVKKVSGYGYKSKQVVKDYRASNKKIVETWWSLDDSLKRSIGENFVVTLPNGRKLVYEKVQASYRIEPDKETKLPRKRLVFTAQMGNRRRVFYGSMIFENLCQAIARDIFYECVDRLESQGISVIFGPYDEACCEVDLDVPKKQIHAAMIVTPDWIKGLPLASDTKEVPCYLK